MSLYKSFDELGAKPQQNHDQFAVVEIQDGQHKSQLLSQNRVVVIDIYADWCGPCRQIAPDYSVMAARYTKPGECVLVKENLDKKLSQGITGIPTFHFFVQGRKVDEVVGANLQEVEDKLNQVLRTPPMSQQQMYSPPQHGQGPPYGRNTIRVHGSPMHGQNNIGGPVQPRPYQPDNGAVYHQPYQGQPNQQFHPSQQQYQQPNVRYQN